MIDSIQIKKLIIKPTLYKLCMLSQELEKLLLRTVKSETNYGSKLMDDSSGGLGIYLMLPHIHNEIWQLHLPKRNDLLMILSSTFNIYKMPPEERLIYDLEYATLMAALHYNRIEEKLSDPKDYDEVLKYYTRFWNAPASKAKVIDLEMRRKSLKKNYTIWDPVI